MSTSILVYQKDYVPKSCIFHIASTKNVTWLLIIDSRKITSRNNSILDCSDWIPYFPCRIRRSCHPAEGARPAASPQGGRRAAPRGVHPAGQLPFTLWTFSAVFNHEEWAKFRVSTLECKDRQISSSRERFTIFSTGVKPGRLPTNDFRMRYLCGYLTFGNDVNHVCSSFLFSLPLWEWFSYIKNSAPLVGARKKLMGPTFSF